MCSNTGPIFFLWATVKIHQLPLHLIPFSPHWRGTHQLIWVCYFPPLSWNCNPLHEIASASCFFKHLGINFIRPYQIENLLLIQVTYRFPPTLQPRKVLFMLLSWLLTTQARLTISENISITSALSVNPLICGSFISCFLPMFILAMLPYVFDHPRFIHTRLCTFYMFLFTSMKRSTRKWSCFFFTNFPLQCKCWLSLDYFSKRLRLFLPYICAQSSSACQILRFLTLMGFILLLSSFILCRRASCCTCRTCTPSVYSLCLWREWIYIPMERGMFCWVFSTEWL